MMAEALRPVLQALCLRARSQAQSHDISTKAQRAKTSSEVFFRFL